MNFLRLSIYTAKDRHAVIELVRDAIVQSHGWITDHTFLSNAMATINFELPVDSITALVARLGESGLRSNQERAVAEDARGECKGQITLVFIHNEPDLRHDVPAFG